MTERRHVKYERLNEAVEDARRLARGCEQAGGWSLEQNLDHLNKAMLIAIDGIDFGLPSLVRPIMRWMFMGRMERLGSDAVKFRAKAPPPLQPSESLDLETLLVEFERLAALIEAPDTVLQPIHPVFGKVNRAQWLIMQRWHAAHHLSYLVPISSEM